jgi:predicted DNA-binding ribbon-helix-helix protein
MENIEEYVKTTIRIRRDIYAEIKKIATIKKLTVSELVENILEEYVKSQRS